MILFFPLSATDITIMAIIPDHLLSLIGDMRAHGGQPFERVMNIEKENSFWVIFIKGILSSAAFSSSFKSFKSFDRLVANFSFNDMSLAAVPIIMSQEIYGLGFPLACDVLKELGYVNYAKSDVHVKTILFECGLVDRYDDYEVFSAVVRMARVCGELPVIVDYVLWSIGAERQRENFIEEVRGRLEVMR